MNEILNPEFLKKIEGETKNLEGKNKIREWIWQTSPNSTSNWRSNYTNGNANVHPHPIIEPENISSSSSSDGKHHHHKHDDDPDHKHHHHHHWNEEEKYQ